MDNRSLKNNNNNNEQTQFFSNSIYINELKFIISKYSYGFNYLYFETVAEAMEAVNFIKNHTMMIPANTQINLDFTDGCRLYFPYVSMYIEYVQSNAKKVKPENDFVFKSLRVDEKSYIHRFTTGEKYPLRLGDQRHFTVTGLGVFKRKCFDPLDSNDRLPIKKQQLTKKQKIGFSNHQSATLGLKSHSPEVFRFSTQNDCVIGVLYDEKHVLFSDRLFLKDIGTVLRSYEFTYAVDALAFYRDHKNKILYSSAQLEEFKQAIKDPLNTYRYNEVMVRLPSNNENAKVFIGNDTLSSRIWAQDLARRIKNNLLEKNLCTKDYVVPILFYTPNSPHLHFKEYDARQQEINNLIAQSRLKLIKIYPLYVQEYFYLLAGSREQILTILNDEEIILSMLYEGSLNLLQSLNQIVGGDQVYQMLSNIIATTDQLTHVAYGLFYAYCQTHKEILSIILDNITLNEILVEDNIKIFEDLFLLTIKKQDAVFFEILLEKRPEILERVDISFLQIVLYTACFYRQIKIIELLFKKLASIYVPELIDKSGSLIVAAECGHVNIVDLLIKHGANISISSNNVVTPLMIAAQAGEVEILEILLNYGANTITTFEKNQALYLAINSGQGSAALILLEANADVNYQINGESPLAAAVLTGNANLVKLILEYGASIDKVSEPDGNTCIHDAVFINNKEILHSILIAEQQQKANIINRINKGGKTALLMAIERGSLEICKMLLMSKADVSKVGDNGLSPLTCAIMHNNADIVKLLIENGADVNQYDKKNETPLVIAIANNNKEMINLLLSIDDINIDQPATLSKVIYSDLYHQYFAEVNAITNDDELYNEVIKVPPIILAKYLGHDDIVTQLENFAKRNQLATNNDTVYDEYPNYKKQKIR